LHHFGGASGTRERGEVPAVVAVVAVVAVESDLLAVPKKRGLR
jgi:hypothetical protein